MAGNTLLELKGLKVAYGGIQAVKGIDLVVREGELVCLIGANGAGKTTTLKGITGLQPVKSGSIHYDGQNITGKPAFQLVRRGLAMVPEGRGVFGALTIEENLAMGAYTRSDRAAIRSDIERVYGLFPRLKERRTQTAGTLSGGEQQMLAMGRAMMSRPKLLLLDEPSMGLAPLMVQKVFETVLTIAGEGVTILLIEQNAKLALEVSDRGYVMESGEVTLSGDAKDLLSDPEGPRGVPRRKRGLTLQASRIARRGPALSRHRRRRAARRGSAARLRVVRRRDAPVQARAGHLVRARAHHPRGGSRPAAPSRRGHERIQDRRAARRMRDADRRGRAGSRRNRCRCAMPMVRSRRAPSAIAAIVVSALAVFAAEALTIYFVAGANLLTRRFGNRRPVGGRDIRIRRHRRAGVPASRLRAVRGPVLGGVFRRCIREQRARLRAQRRSAPDFRRAGRAAGRAGSAADGRRIDRRVSAAVGGNLRRVEGHLAVSRESA